MYINVYTSRYTWHCTYDKLYVQCHVYLLVYTIMYMLYSSHIIICTMTCIPTGIYNNVHAIVYNSRYTWHDTYDNVIRIEHVH
jgi:predicted DCC family thiol-disulfide oxidoreductase YuxK